MQSSIKFLFLFLLLFFCILLYLIFRFTFFLLLNPLQIYQWFSVSIQVCTFQLLQLFLPQFIESSINFSLLFLCKFIVLLLLDKNVIKKILWVDECMSFVQILDIIQCFHQLHFSFRIVCFGFQEFHRIALLLLLSHFLHKFLSLLCILNRLIVPRPTIFNNIIMIFRISFETNLIITISTLQIEPKDFNTKISFLITNFHPHIKFSTNIQIICTYITSQRHWQHITDIHQFIFTSTSFHQEFRIEILREIFYQDFSFSHLFFYIFFVSIIYYILYIIYYRVQVVIMGLWQGYLGVLLEII